MGVWRFLPYFWRRSAAPIYLIFEPTLRCNSTCGTCYNLPLLNQPMREVSLDEIDRWSRSLGGRLLVLALSGGEPFLREDLSELVAVFHRNTKMEHLSIPTNGLLTDRVRRATEEILTRTPCWFALHLSLDGLGPLHDDIRGVPGNFERLLETYDALVPLADRHPRLQLSVNTTLNRKNVHQLRDLADFVRTRLPKARNHTFAILRRPPSSDLDFDVPGFLRENRALLREIVWSQRPYAFDPLSFLNTAYNALYYDLSEEVRSTGKRSFDCYGGSLACYVDAHANVYPCEMLRPIGNLRDADWDFARVFGSPKAHDARRAIARRECACDHGCFLQVSTLFNPRMYPRLARAALSGARR